MSKLAKALIAAAGNSGGAGLTVEDVFSTYLYTGTGADQTITNGIDLSGEGGLTWIKGRDTAYDHRLFDTDRGAGKMLSSNNTGAEQTLTEQLEAFNADGFQVGNNLGINGSGSKYASWTFRKAEKFFDVVTYTGNGVAGRTVSHNLGSVPACIIVKLTSGSGGWIVYHVGTDATNPEQKYLQLNSTNAVADQTWPWNDTAPTDTEFTVGTGGNINGNGDTYVAYLFASDAGGFGDDGSESIIKCGSYTGNGGTQEINLGFEPQWVLIKRTSETDYYGWQLYDIMRGMPVGSADAYLRANLSSSELSYDDVDPTATGMIVKSGSGGANASSADYIYIAIRRPMKTPESGTEVFAVTELSSPYGKTITTGWPVDMTLHAEVSATGNRQVIDRLRGTASSGSTQYLSTNSTSSEAVLASYGYSYDNNTGYLNNLWGGTDGIFYDFKRATGFFDVVAYTGNSIAGRTVNHNLGVAPELMIFKTRNATGSWIVYHTSLGAGKFLYMNFTNAATTSTLPFNGTDPTSEVFTVGNYTHTNGSGDTMIAYLFGSVDGVSKVFSVTKSSGSNANVDCGFSAGARFILLKRTDSTGDWYVWDSVRGIVSGNDPYLLLNSTAAEVTTTDYIDPLASGFTIVDGGLANGDYIGLAIA